MDSVCTSARSWVKTVAAVLDADVIIRKIVDCVTFVWTGALIARECVASVLMITLSCDARVTPLATILNGRDLVTCVRTGVLTASERVVWVLTTLLICAEAVLSVRTTALILAETVLSVRTTVRSLVDLVT